MNTILELNDMVRRNAEARGADGVAWIAGLAHLVAKLAHEWNIAIGRTFPNATQAFVAEALRADGEKVVLKIPLGGAKAAASEVQTLQAASGRGYARLLCHQFEGGAMLLERLGPQLAQMDMPLDSRLQTICETLKSAWMPLPPGMRVMTGREKAQSMTTYIRPVWRRLGRPCSEQVIAVALRFGQARSDAFDPATAVLGHGDPHCWNTLFDPKSGAFRFVDPEGLFIERAHDLSICMREWSAELLTGDTVILGKRRCEILAHAAGIDPGPIWQWGFIERLVNGLLYLERGLDGTAQEFLEVAEAWALAEAG